MSNPEKPEKVYCFLDKGTEVLALVLFTALRPVSYNSASNILSTKINSFKCHQWSSEKPSLVQTFSVSYLFSSTCCFPTHFICPRLWKYVLINSLPINVICGKQCKYVLYQCITYTYVAYNTHRLLSHIYYFSCIPKYG